MTTRIHPILLLLAIAAGCSAASSTKSMGGGGAGRADAAGPAGMGGSGGTNIKADGGVVIAIDAAGAIGDGGPSQVPPNLFTDAPVFVWDRDTLGCTTCNPEDGGAGGSGQGGSVGGAGGVTAAGGASAVGGRSGSGGAPSSGGSSAIGGSDRGGTTGASTSGSGGRVAGTGGASGWGGAGSGGYRADAAVAADAGTPGSDAGSVDLGPPASDAASDLRGPDVLVPDIGTRCDVRIRSVVPATDLLAQYPLVAGTNVQVVLRAEIAAGGPASPVWTWQASRDGSPIWAAAYGQPDRASAAFPVAVDGNYTFTVVEQSSPLCSATAHAVAFPANACAACDRSVILRAAPPPGADLPVQSGAIALGGSEPFGGTNVVLAKGVLVLVSPNVGGSKVASYVRINGVGGDLVADGLADPRAGFGAQLLRMDNNLAVLRYDVLVVPLDGSNGSSYAATAPQLFQSYTPDQINAASFALAGGVAVSGRTTASSGQAVVDARVILTNRDPNAAVQPSALLFSSVGRSDAQGDYVLHVQPGRYWVSVSPPNGSGLAEALATSAIDLPGAATISFQWNASAMAALTLYVRDALGAPLDGARVRLTSAQATTVGRLTVSGAGTNASLDAVGNVSAEETTAVGAVTFANLPTGAVYDALIVPAALGPSTATTAVTVTVPAGGATQTVQLLPQGTISGKLLSGVAGADWSQVYLVAYDRSADTPEPPQTASVNPDGSFSIGASPRRPYVVLAVPAPGSALARTFVGPGPLETSEFVITQKVQDSMQWSAKVMDENGLGLEGTALQVFCGPSWPGCIDPSVPLAETTSESGGVFQLDLPDPATR
ncbi:MAG: carboxypeptidase regulatory-like domain-containing protein [Deltaproteobacteria bacterium]|nr:carboxypeptidase regulatory-like domain-containing protein [Deltaproteobacteria bacterium]